MKKHILFLCGLLILACSSDDAPVDQESLLPPITQTGENTFGCLVDGKYFRPRDGRASLQSDNRGLYVVRTENDNLEIHVYDRKSENGGSMFIHLEDFYINGEGTYDIGNANGSRGIDGPNKNYIYGRFYNSEEKRYYTYLSRLNQDSIAISNFSLISSIENVKSGVFSAVLVNSLNENDTILLDLGRFDLDSFTLESKSWD